MNLARKFLILAVGALLISNLYAQPSMNFSVKGRVLEDNSESGLEYVNVVLYSLKDSSLVAGTITLNDGSFTISTKKPGKYYLTADFIGYEKAFVNEIILKPGSETQYLGAIKIKSSNVGINEVEVVAERPYMTYKIDKKIVEVSKNPLAQGGTAVDALENVPSIETDIEGGITVRGSTDFTVLIDGRQSPLTGSDALNQIPASAIDKIEIITNPSVKYDPDGTAGIINVITKKGKLQGHSLVVNATLGSSPMSSANVNYSYRMKKGNLYLGAGYRDMKMDFETFSDRTTIDSATGETSWMYTSNNGQMEHGSSKLSAGFDYFLSPKNTLTASASYNTFNYGRTFDSEIETTEHDLFKSYELTGTDFSVDPNSWQVKLGDKQVFGDDSEHFLTLDFLYQTTTDNNNDQLYAYASNSEWEIISPATSYEKALTSEEAARMRFDLNYSKPIASNHMLEAGYTWRYDESNQDYFRYYNEEESWVNNSEYDDKSQYLRTINAAWFLIKGDIKGVGYSIGLRGEHTDRMIKTERDNTEYPYDYFGHYPSVSLSKEWQNGQTLQASYSARINRPRDHHLNPFPSLSDGYTARVPNPSLEPEYASSYELNYQKSWGRNFVALETFYKITENKMTRIFETEDTLLIRTIKNLGKDESIGGEITANLSLFKWWSVNPMARLYYYKLAGEYDGGDTTKHSTNSYISLTNNFVLSSKTRIQLMGKYRGPSVSLDGESEDTYWLSAAVRHEFFDRKLSAVFRVDDILGTRRRAGTTISEYATVYTEGKRKAPMYVMSLSYKFNQAQNKSERGSGESGGMDMDF